MKVCQNFSYHVLDFAVPTLQSLCLPNVFNIKCSLISSKLFVFMYDYVNFLLWNLISQWNQNVYCKFSTAGKIKNTVTLGAFLFTKEEKKQKNGLCILDFSLEILFLIHTFRI